MTFSTFERILWQWGVKNIQTALMHNFFTYTLLYSKFRTNFYEIIVCPPREHTTPQQKSVLHPHATLCHGGRFRWQGVECGCAELTCYLAEQSRYRYLFFLNIFFFLPIDDLRAETLVRIQIIDKQ